MVIMELLSERYGWLPSEIREQKISDIHDYLDIIAIKNMLAKNNLKK